MRSFGVVRRIAPTDEQQAQLGRSLGACRFAQNALLAMVKQSLETGTQMSWTSISLHTTWRQIRDEQAPWYAQVSKECFQYGAERASLALANWNASKKGKRVGRKVGFPRFRKRGSNDSVKFTAAKLRDCGTLIHLPRVGEVHLAEGFQLADGQRVTSVTVRCVAGRWFATLLVREEIWTEPVKRAGSTIGVDFGVGDRFATLSDGLIIDNPRFLRAGEKRLARAQQALTRKQKGSANRRKARLRVARVHYRISCRRQDFVHKFTTALSKTHARIVVEDLNLVGMSNKAGFKLGKSVHDAALSEARRQLEYKTSWDGSELIVADRWFPSSKTCHVCKAISTGLKLSDRSWECLCGATQDRDLNAAINLSLLAGSSLVSACGEDLSPELALAVVCEAGSDAVRFDLVS